jgi:hypothetical protein
VSPEGRRVYFVAHGKLANNPSALGAEAVAGANNLYVYEPDDRHPGQFKTVFIGALVAGDHFGEAGLWKIQVGLGAEATPATDTGTDGRYLLFASKSDLTRDAAGTGRQLYRYDSEAEEGKQLVRVSIGQHSPAGFECPATKTIQEGFNCNGNNGDEMRMARSVAQIGGSRAGPLGVSISDDGAYVFFQSRAGLTPQALNDQQIGETAGTPFFASNVYEYHEGQVYLVSVADSHAVENSSTVLLIGASHSGQDVYFRTADPLVTQDTDTQQDIYDARVGGGFSTAPAGGPPCQQE